MVKKTIGQEIGTHLVTLSQETEEEANPRLHEFKVDALTVVIGHFHKNGRIPPEPASLRVRPNYSVLGNWIRDHSQTLQNQGTFFSSIPFTSPAELQSID